MLSRVGIIDKIIKSTEGSKETWKISGVEAKGITSWRNISTGATGFDHYTSTGPAETVIKSAITQYLKTSTRNIDLINVPETSSTGSTYMMSERLSTLSDALEDCSNATGVWWRFEINTSTGKLDVKVTIPTDRSQNQSANRKASFSVKFHTLKDYSRTDDYSKFANVAIVAGPGEGVDRLITTVGSATGWDRRETFIDGRNVKTLGDMDTQGASELVTLGQTVGIDLTALSKSQLTCDVDYFVGDIVTVASYGIEEDVPISEVSESWSDNGYEIDLTFGTSVATRESELKAVKSVSYRAVTV